MPDPPPHPRTSARRRAARARARWAPVAGLAVALAGCRREHPTWGPPVAADARVVVVPRTPELATYPCMERCHVRRTPDPRPRALREFHAGREVRHGPVLHWCDSCHRIADLDQLQLLDGQAVSFDAAPRLCGQCHQARLHEWEHGLHGLQTGAWAGEQRRRSCTGCHDPHDPHRPVFQALPPPVRERL